MGAGRAFVDLISRPMYASAGAAEEVFSPEGGGVAAVPGRVAREVFSGLPGVHGEKRDFIEVMERAGVPELGHLSDLISPLTPGLGGITGVFNPSGRGMLGFAADVVFDPTTWVTYGGSTVGRFATAKGVLNLNKRGLAAKDAVVKDLSLIDKMLTESSNPVLRETGRREVREVLESRVRAAISTDPSLLEKTGLKFMGQEMISPRVLKNLTEPVKTMILSAPGGGRAARLAESWGDGMRRLFDPFADLAKLDPDAKEGVKNMMREYQSALAANAHRESQGWAQIQAEEARLARKYGRGDAGVQVLGKKFADWRQGTGAPALTDQELDLFRNVAANYDGRSEINVSNGVISGEQYDKYKGRYLHQDYKNKEVLSEEMVRQAVADGLLPQARVNKERQFETYADAVRISRGLEREGKLARERGVVRQMYGELIPEYSISKNLWSHIEQSNRAIFQKKLFEGVTQKYGAKIEDFYDPSRVYAIHEAVEVAPKDRAIIEDFLGNNKTLKSVAEAGEFKTIRPETPQVRLARENLQAAYDEWNTIKFFEQNAKARGAHTPQVSIYQERIKTAQGLLDKAKAQAEQDIRIMPRGEGWDALTKEIRTTLPTLSADGQREFSRQLTSMARDESHALRVMEAVGESLMTPVKAMREGDINPFFLKHGLPEQKSRLVPRGGGVWGDQPHLIPQAIADMLDDAPRDLLADKLFRKNLGIVLKGWDTIGNLFKGITYPFYPAGAVRDAYNNLQHSFLALGVGGLSRPDLAARVRVGVEAPITLRAMTKTGKEWRTLSEDLRVVDPSASSFVQTTGKEGAEKASLYSKARALRGQVDNGTRTQLWLNGIRMGMTPEDAARMVHEFLYNYSELSPFDRDIMRRAIPFYVFPRKTIGLYPGVAARTPGRLVNLHKPFMGRSDENQEMTQWEGEGFKLRLDRNGRDVTMLNGVDLPVRSFDMLWSGGLTKSLERLVGSAHPIPKVWYMMTSGRDPFRGQEMSRASAPALGRLLENGPKPIKDWLGWKKTNDQAGRPVYTVNEEKLKVVLEVSMLSRVFSTSDAYFRDMVHEPGAPDFWLRFFTGLRFKTLNLDDEQKRKLEDSTKAAEEEAVKQGTLRQGTYSYRPKQ
jgi:hypothetical protein